MPLMFILNLDKITGILNDTHLWDAEQYAFLYLMPSASADCLWKLITLAHNTIGLDPVNYKAQQGLISIRYNQVGYKKYIQYNAKFMETNAKLSKCVFAQVHTQTLLKSQWAKVN